MEKVELLSIAKDIAKKQLQKQCEDIDLDPLMPIGMGIWFNIIGTSTYFTSCECMFIHLYG